MNHRYLQLIAAIAIVMSSDLGTIVRAQDKLVEGFTLTLTFEKAEFQQGEGVRATLVLSNTLAEGRRTSMSGELNCYDIEVLGPSGNILPRGPESILFSHGCFGWFQPCEARITKFDLNPHLFNLSEPGEYVIAASCPVPIRGTETYRVENILGREIKVPSGFKETPIQSERQVIRIVATSEVSQVRSPPSEAFNPESTINKSIGKPNQAVVPSPPGRERNASTSSQESPAAVLAGSVSSTSGSSGFTPVRKTGIAILAALLALLLAIFWRASRRKPEA